MVEIESQRRGVAGDEEGEEVAAARGGSRLARRPWLGHDYFDRYVLYPDFFSYVLREVRPLAYAT